MVKKHNYNKNPQKKSFIPSHEWDLFRKWMIHLSQKIWLLIGYKILGAYNLLAPWQPEKDLCCIFWPAFGCCTLQTLVIIYNIYVFNCIKLKNTRNLQQNYARNKNRSNYSKQCVSFVKYKVHNLPGVLFRSKNYAWSQKKGLKVQKNYVELPFCLKVRKPAIFPLKFGRDENISKKRRRQRRQHFINVDH